MDRESLEAACKNIDFVACSDQGGRGDGVQIMVHREHAYIGHMFSNGVTVMDVSDARNPRPVNFLPTPPNTWALHLQAHDDLLLVVNAVNIYSPAIHIEKAEYYSQSFADTFGKQQLEFTAGMCGGEIFTPGQPRRVWVFSGGGGGVHSISSTSRGQCAPPALLALAID